MPATRPARCSSATTRTSASSLALLSAPRLTDAEGRVRAVDVERPLAAGGGTLRLARPAGSPQARALRPPGDRQPRDLGASLDDGEAARGGPACVMPGRRRRPVRGSASTAWGRSEYKIHVPRRSPVDPAGVAEHLEVVRDGRLADVAAGGEVAGADLGAVAQLAEDREPGRVGGGLQEQDVGVGLALHVDQCIDRCLYRQVSIQQRRPPHRGALRDDHRDHPRDRPAALRRRRGPRLPGLLVLQRSRDDRREPVLRPRARRAAGRRRPRLPGLRQPDRRRRPPSGRARPRPRVGWRHRRPALGQAGRADRPGVRGRHDRRDAGPRPARTPPRPARPTSSSSRATSKRSRSRPSRSTS